MSGDGTMNVKFDYWTSMYRHAHSPLSRISAATWAARAFTHKRLQFLWRLTEHLGKRARVTRRTTVLWFDAFGRIGNAQVFAHLHPETYEPDRPLIMRVAVNNYYGLGLTWPLVTRLGCPRDHEPELANCRPRFELSVTPEEIVDFAPWVAGVIKRYETGGTFDDPPRQLCEWQAPVTDVPESLWTKQALQEMHEFIERSCARRTPVLPKKEGQEKWDK